VVGALERSGSLCTASKIHALGAAAGLHYLSSNSEKKAEGLANFNGKSRDGFCFKFVLASCVLPVIVSIIGTICF
jgi:uncharacterized membrane protein